jgi:hypothetical protein
MHIILAAFVCIAALAGAAHAQTVDVTGTWDLTFNTQNGPMSAALTLRKEGDKLAGTLSGPQGDVAVEGTQKEAAVALNLSVQTPNGPFAIAMSGTQTGDSLAGTVDFGGRGQGEWSGKRKAVSAASSSSSSSSPGARQAQTEKPADVAGVWAFTIQTGNGTGTPTVTFKQDGEKLTGTYDSPLLGTHEFTGSIKGNAITFGFEAAIEGNAIKLTYTGTVDKDTMKGTVVFGELGEGTFTGTRKK